MGIIQLRTNEMAVEKKKRKVFVPILVVDKTKESFDKKKGSMTADAYLNQLMK